MAIRSTIRYLFKKLFRGFQSRQSTHIESEADAPLESALTPSPKASNTERPQRFLRDRYQVNEKANIEYIDKSGSRTTRTILTEEVYEYSDGALVIRAYCYKRKNYRTFISSRVQLWTDIARGAITKFLKLNILALFSDDRQSDVFYNPFKRLKKLLEKTRKLLRRRIFIFLVRLSDTFFKFDVKKLF